MKASTASLRVGKLEQQLTREVAGASRGVRGILVRGIAAASSSSLVDCLKSADDVAGGNSTLGDKVGQQLGLVAEQIDTISGVEEAKSQITNKVVLDKVPLGDNISTGFQNGSVNESVSVGGVERQIGGPCVHVHVVLDVIGRKIVNIKRIALELEDILHISQPDLVDSNATSIESGGCSGSNLTGNTESEVLVKTSKDKVHHHIIVYNNNQYFIFT